MEQSEGSSEQATCSNEPTERSEQTEIPFEQRSCELTERTEPTTAVEHAECSSKQPERSYENPGCSIEQTAPAEPAKDVEPCAEWSEPWLEAFAEHLQRLPPLFRSMYVPHCKPKSARGFAYIRLMTALGLTEGEVQERITRAGAFCKEFFRLLKKKMRAVASECLDGSPDEALRGCPAWVRRADSYLNLMPFIFASLNSQRNLKRNPKKLAAPRAAPRVSREAAACATGAAGARVMRRVARGMRRAAGELGGPTRAAAAAVATRLGDTEERVFALWCGMRKLAELKLRALLCRGDAPSESGRLDALDWSVVDLLIMYGISLVGEESYQNYEQLSALLGTFHLVQRFGLESPGQRVLLSKWSEAARWYSRNRVQMSALGLQKRWLELKMDTRRRMLSRLRHGARASEPLPLHQAIARRYEHVVVAKGHPSSWKRLVWERRVARPTSERGPAPGEPTVSRTIGDDDSSESDTAAAGDVDGDDDDDLTIIEKTLETIDLSDDETDTNEAARVPSDTQVPESHVSRSLPSLEATSSESISENTNVSRQFDKTIDVNKEIVDLDAPSPKSNVLQALQGLDVGNVQTTILFESDEDDVTNIDVTSVDNSASVNNNNKSHDNNRRESIDSEDGNLVIDCEDSDSANDVRNANHNIVWKEIESEMIPEPLNDWAPLGGYSQSDAIDSVSDETKEKYPLLARMLQTKSVLESFATVSPKVYYNTKRYHVAKAQKQYANASKAVSVGRKDIQSGPDRSQVDVSLSAARVEECGDDLMSEVGGEVDEGSKGESGEQQDGMGVIDAKLLMYAVVILRRIDEEIPQILSLQSTPPPTQFTPPPPYLCPRESPPPPPLSAPNATIPSHSQSLFNYYAATLSPKFIFNKRNIPLLKQCKPCVVVLRRAELGERAERVAMSRIAKKVELPDIEQVRRNHRTMLTAQVAPLAPRREGYVSSPEPPTCSSDSDWTPDAERPRPPEPHPALPDLAEPHSAEPHSAESADEEAETEAESGRPGATSAELEQLLNDLLAESGSNGDCNHEKSTGVRGPLSSVFAESCASCALRVLSAPPVSGVEARLQRRLLRRLAKAAKQPTTTTVTTAVSNTATTTNGSTATVPTVTDAAERKEKSRKSRSKSASQKRRRPPSPRAPPPPTPPPPRPPPRPRSPDDPEAAAREWLRQKNIAAEKFGVKPRSFKKPVPVVQPPEAPATLQPLGTTPQVPQLEPPAMQATNQVPKPAQNQPLPRVDNIQVDVREAIASVSPPTDTRHPAQPFRVTCGPVNNSAQSSNSILLNQTNSAPLLNQTNSVFNKNSAQMSSVSILNQKKAPEILNHTAPTILNEINAPPLFNPNAVASLNKIVTLAPTTEAEGFGFHPVITNVHSLAAPKTSPFRNAKKDTKTQHNFIIIPASNPTGGTSILLRTQESEVAKPSENVFSSPQTSLPQVTNVIGGVHLPSASVSQGLHLIVSQSPQKTNAPMLTNILNQPKMVVSGNMIENVQKQQVSVWPAMSNYLVTSMPQLVQSQPLLVSCTSLATPTSASQPSVFSSLPIRTSHAAPMLVRSVQAGGSQQNVSVQSVSQQNSVSQGNVVSQPDPVSQQNAVTQENALSRHILTQASLSQDPKVAAKSDDANKDSDPLPLVQRRGMLPYLDWRPAPVPSRRWVLRRDSTSVCVLCTGPREAAGWVLSGYLLVSEEELPASRAAYWTTRPRARLLLPDEEPFSPAKRRKVDPDTSKSWLKVKAFARLVPEDSQKDSQDSQKDSQDSQKDSQEPLTAPGRVFVNNITYQKLSDNPLVYAKLLVAVRDARACRALLARGAALQLYCLRTGTLFPLQTEPKADVSRITLSGDEEVSGALVALATQLYKLPDSRPQTPVADADRQARTPEISDTDEEGRECAEPSEAEPRPAKRPRVTPPAERRIELKLPPLVTSPPCRPADVIELSDED